MINDLVNAGVEMLIIPQINTMGRQGVEIPSIMDRFRFSNVTFGVDHRFLVVQVPVSEENTKILDIFISDLMKKKNDNL